jgi:transformation/transcription domain-associated protein
LDHHASIVLRLFKIVFGSVTLFKTNESALFPHLRTIIESCLKEATITRHPDNYLLLLRALFGSILGGKYETFYKEVFPLLPGILSALMRLQQQTSDARCAP